MECCPAQRARTHLCCVMDVLLVTSPNGTRAVASHVPPTVMNADLTAMMWTRLARNVSRPTRLDSGLPQLTALLAETSVWSAVMIVLVSNLALSVSAVDTSLAT